MDISAAFVPRVQTMLARTICAGAAVPMGILAAEVGAALKSVIPGTPLRTRFIHEAIVDNAGLSNRSLAIDPGTGLLRRTGPKRLALTLRRHARRADHSLAAVRVDAIADALLPLSLPQVARLIPEACTLQANLIIEWRKLAQNHFIYGDKFLPPAIKIKAQAVEHDYRDKKVEDTARVYIFNIREANKYIYVPVEYDGEEIDVKVLESFDWPRVRLEHKGAFLGEWIYYRPKERGEKEGGFILDVSKEGESGLAKLALWRQALRDFVEGKSDKIPGKRLLTAHENQGRARVSLFSLGRSSEQEIYIPKEFAGEKIEIRPFRNKGGRGVRAYYAGELIDTWYWMENKTPDVPKYSFLKRGRVREPYPELKEYKARTEAAFSPESFDAVIMGKTRTRLRMIQTVGVEMIGRTRMGAVGPVLGRMVLLPRVYIGQEVEMVAYNVIGPRYYKVFHRGKEIAKG